MALQNLGQNRESHIVNECNTCFHRLSFSFVENDPAGGTADGRATRSACSLCHRAPTASLAMSVAFCRRAEIAIPPSLRSARNLVGNFV